MQSDMLGGLLKDVGMLYKEASEPHGGCTNFRTLDDGLRTRCSNM